MNPKNNLNNFSAKPEFNKIDKIRNDYKVFILNTLTNSYDFRLTPNAEPSPYARCFAIFGLHLLGEVEILARMADQLASSIDKDLEYFRHKRLSASVDLAFDKPYMQLLCFSLSALSILNRHESVSLEDHVEPLLSKDMKNYLAQAKCLKGMEGSGNMAMFIAILNLYAVNNLNMERQLQIDCWVEEHLRAMNKFGFWSEEKSMTHLQFQNGYHQYEIFEYLNVRNPKAKAAAEAVAALADAEGHFGPYPGGGGCYDYDAVAIITGYDRGRNEMHHGLLSRTAQTIINEQNEDGGFCESKYIRPITLKNIMSQIKHVYQSTWRIRMERSIHMLHNLRQKNNQINTHWSNYSRDWYESDLWDSWFRMLTIARIQMELSPNLHNKWGFINFPGIGFHRCE
jgi:hypothetical protein